MEPAFLTVHFNGELLENTPMAKDSTQTIHNQLLQVVYADVEQTDLVDLVRRVTTDYSLREELDELEATRRRLPDLKLAPRQRSIDAILAYSRQTSPSSRRTRRDSSSQPLSV